jgi:hypothetical protein
MYMLLDIEENEYDAAMRVLNSIDGVIHMDQLEGHPNVMVIVEASDRQGLVDLMMPVLGSVDDVTGDFHLLVTREDKAESCTDHSGDTALLVKQTACPRLSIAG